MQLNKALHLDPEENLNRRVSNGSIVPPTDMVSIFQVDSRDVNIFRRQ